MKALWSRYVLENRIKVIATVLAAIFVLVTPWGLVGRKVWDCWIRLDASEKIAFAGLLTAGTFALLEKINR